MCICYLSKNHSIASIVWAIKRPSSKWAKSQGAMLRKFHWQDGYGAFSVSQSHVEQVQKYILNQEAHHRRRSFKDEFRGFLKNMRLTTTNGTFGIEGPRRTLSGFKRFKDV